MPRQPSKCREWEKDRRDRLNNSFCELSKKLPCYQPSLNISKIEILQKAAVHIDELDAQVKDLLANKAPKITCEKIKKLRDQIKKLLIRNEQLCNLLKDAGIKYPSECGLVKFKAPKKWTNKISADQAKVLAEKEAQKENDNTNTVKEKKTNKSRKKKVSLKSVQKARVKRKEHKKMIQSAFRLNIAQSNLLGLVTTQSCFIITNAPKVCQSNISKTTTVLTDSRILSTPLVASTMKPTGTVFVANNNILPFIHQPALVSAPILASNPVIVNSSLPRVNNIVPTILTNTPILVNTSVNNAISVKISQEQKVPAPNSTNINGPSTTCLSVKSNNISTAVNLPKMSTKSLPPLRPKAFTRTTQVNKVPIPALSSEYNKCLLKSIKLNSGNSANTIKCSVNKKREIEKSGALNKGTTPKQNLISNIDKVEKPVENSKEDDGNSLTEKKDNLMSATETNINDVKEPPGKKLKLDEENGENKKVPTALTYSIDALCNDIPETTDNCTKIVEENINKQDEADSTKGNQEEVKTTEPEKEVVSTAKANHNENNSVSDTTVILSSVQSQKENEIHEKKAEIINPNGSKDDEFKVPELSDALGHSELSNDIFASLSHVAAGGQNPESTSPTAAFLLAFPLVSSLNSLKVTEVIEDEATDSQRGTPTLLQIGTMDTTKTTQSQSDTLTPSLLNLDNFSFFPKEFYPSFDIIATTAVTTNNTDSIVTLITNTSVVTSVTTSTSTKSDSTSINISSTTGDVNKSPRTSISVSSTSTVTTSSTNTNNLNSLSSNNIPSTGHSKPIVKKENFERTKSTSTLSYSSTKTDATFPTVNGPSTKHEGGKKIEKPSDVHVMTPTNSYVPPNTTYNFSYNNSVFSSHGTLVNDTISISSEKDKHKTEKKPSCYYPCTTYSVSNATSNYSLPTVTPASYSLPAVSTASYPTTVTTSSYPLVVTTTISQYNTFNPFTDLPTKTSSYVPSKPYNDMLYTNNSYTYTYGDNLNTTYTNNKNSKDKNYYGFNYDNYEYKEFQKSYEVTKNQHNQTYCYNNNQPTHQSKEKHSLKSVPNNTNNTGNTSRPPVNWMTTPDIRQQTQEFTPFSKEMEFGPSTIYSSFSSVTQNSYFNNTSYATSDFHPTFPEARKIDTFPTIPNSFQRPEEENQFSWSPSKLPHMLDPPHSFISNTLPTLVGDLALGTQPVFTEQKEKNRNNKDTKRNKMQNNFDASQNNFLSVSQLVDHNKTNNEGGGNPNRISNRRTSSSGNRSSNKNSSSKISKRSTKTDNTKEVQSYGGNNNKPSGEKHVKHQGNQGEYTQTQGANSHNDWLSNNAKNRNVKSSSSNYSAEALIGHQNNDTRQRNQQSYNPIVNKTLPVPFLAENLLPYFPPVDIPQENNLLPQNQNYHQSSTFGHSFTSTIQNNVYTNNSFAPTNFNLPDMSANPTDYNTGLVDNTFGHIMPKPTEKFNKPKNNATDRHDEKRSIQSSTNNSCSLNQLATSKKPKKKQPEPALPGLVDFSFLPMPGAINSPILPDDFHSHTNFLPPPPTPTQLYPCKNPLYGKQTAELSHNHLLTLPSVTRAAVPHPEISPSLNSMGSSLTNFNLSTIFPEINKGSTLLDTMYQDASKAKDYPHRDFLGAPQVSFPKNNTAMNYIHSTSTNS